MHLPNEFTGSLFHTFNKHGNSVTAWEVKVQNTAQVVCEEANNFSFIGPH